jgi:hypothetical protein
MQGFRFSARQRQLTRDKDCFPSGGVPATNDLIGIQDPEAGHLQRAAGVERHEVRERALFDRSARFPGVAGAQACLLVLPAS